MTTWKQIRTWAAALAAALLAIASPTGGEEKPSRSMAGTPGAPKVFVTDTGNGGYRIEGLFGVEATPLAVWGVLTDYDNLSSFVTSMRSSSSSRDEWGQLVVAQEAVGHAGPFSRTMRVVLDVTEEPPGRIEFRDVSGKSFHSYVGAWSICTDGTGSEVKYELDARPRSTPPFFARSILSSNARDLLAQVQREVVRRGRTAVAR